MCILTQTRASFLNARSFQCFFHIFTHCMFYIYKNKYFYKIVFKYLNFFFLIFWLFVFFFQEFFYVIFYHVYKLIFWRFLVRFYNRSPNYCYYCSRGLHKRGECCSVRTDLPEIPIPPEPLLYIRTIVFSSRMVWLSPLVHWANDYQDRGSVILTV